jgi:hypothetical protein
MRNRFLLFFNSTKRFPRYLKYLAHHVYQTPDYRFALSRFILIFTRPSGISSSLQLQDLLSKSRVEANTNKANLGALAKTVIFTDSRGQDIDHSTRRSSNLAIRRGAREPQIWLSFHLEHRI